MPSITMLLRIESCIYLSKNLMHDITSGSTDTQLSYNDDNVFISPIKVCIIIIGSYVHVVPVLLLFLKLIDCLF